MKIVCLDESEKKHSATKKLPLQCFAIGHTLGALSINTSKTLLLKKSRPFIGLGPDYFRWTNEGTSDPHGFSVSYTLKFKKNLGGALSSFVFGLQRHLKSNFSFFSVFIRKCIFLSYEGCKSSIMVCSYTK